MGKIKDMCLCAACGNAFVSKIGEHLCQKCCEDREFMQDKLDISNIIGRRGYHWVEDTVNSFKENDSFGN